MKTKNTVIYALIVLVVVAIVIFLSFRKSEAPAPSTQQIGAEQKVKNMDNEQKTNEETAQKAQPQAPTPLRSESLADGAVNVKVFQEGKGEAAKNGETVSMAYIGKLTDGKVFDTNITNPQKGEVRPFDFTIGEGHVIKGWEVGIVGMKVGEVRELEIKPEYAYGEKGQGSIPANATLIFTVQLLGIKK